MQSGPDPQPLRARLGRLAVVFAGILVTQFIIYGPSLLGWKILLPLDCLADPGIYLPASPEVARIPRHDATLSDLVYQFEPDRLFATAELHAGRFPFWAPYQFAGAPFVWPKYSPFLLFQCLTASPVILAWAQMLVAMVTGFGAYAFLRRAVELSFWPSALSAWCWPLTGFFVFWQGFPTCAAAFWLPWLLLAVQATVRLPRSLAPAALSVATMLTLISGHIDVAGQVLLVSGLYALWKIVAEHGARFWLGAARSAVIAVALGWTFGFLLAAPHVMPLLEYAQTGARITQRSGGVEERPPGDWSALPAVVLPDVYGSTVKGSVRLAAPINIESSSAAYMGLIATLFLAPLAWCSRRHRAENFFWLALAVFGLAWVLGLPGIISILRLPGMNMMSHNRLVFATAFAVLVLSAIGLETLWQSGFARRGWFALPAALLAGLGGWSLWRGYRLPARIGRSLTVAMSNGTAPAAVTKPDDVAQVQDWFTQSNAVAAVLCGIGVLLWIAAIFGVRWSLPRRVALALVLVGEMLWFAYGRSAQADPRWYYPRIAVLTQIAAAEPGRVIGYSCLPAQLAQTHGLDDVRGYDSIDPARMVELLRFGTSPDGPQSHYAATQFLSPRGDLLPPDGIRLSPVLDLLCVRYVIFRGTPPPSLAPAFQGADYWALINRNALPRIFVPRQWKMESDPVERLARLGAADFDPRKIAIVETALQLQETMDGTASISSETPTRIIAALDLKTPSLVVLADHYDGGWQAYFDGRPTTSIRVDHALRGAIVPAGKWTLEFRYEPASVAMSFALAGVAAFILVGWVVANRVARRATAG